MCVSVCLSAMKKLWISEHIVGINAVYISHSSVCVCVSVCLSLLTFLLFYFIFWVGWRWGAGCCSIRYVSLLRLVSKEFDGRQWVISRPCYQICSISYGSRDTVWYHNFDISVRPWKIKEILKSPFSMTFHNIVAPWNWRVLFSWNFYGISFFFFFFFHGVG